MNFRGPISLARRAYDEHYVHHFHWMEREFHFAMDSCLLCCSWVCFMGWWPYLGQIVKSTVLINAHSSRLCCRQIADLLVENNFMRIRKLGNVLINNYTGSMRSKQIVSRHDSRSS